MVFFMFLSMGMSMDYQYFKTTYGYEFFWFLASLAFAGLAVSIFRTVAIIIVTWVNVPRNGGY